MPSLSGGRGLHQNLRTASEVVCDGVPFGEGPVWCEDGTLVVTSVAEGALYRVEPNQNQATKFADSGSIASTGLQLPIKPIDRMAAEPASQRDC